MLTSNTYVESETEGAQAQVNPVANKDTAVATKIDNFIQPKPSDPGDGSGNDCFDLLAEEFSVTKKIAPVSLEDVREWSSNIWSATRKILRINPDVVVYTDASQTGWGAQIDHGNNTCGIWSMSESLRHKLLRTVSS